MNVRPLLPVSVGILVCTCAWSLSFAEDLNFRRGDSDGDSQVDITDPVFTLGFLFLGTASTTCQDAADSDDDGFVDITDPIRTLSMLFLGGPLLPAPGQLVCGPDPTLDDLGCGRYEACAQGITLTRIARTSPVSGEEGVAVTRETILYFSGPLDPASVTPAAVTARFGGSDLPTSHHLSADRTVLTVFYAVELPASARVRVTVEGGILRDQAGEAVDADRDGAPGGTFSFDFDTLTLTTLDGTAVFGRVFASELGDGGVNKPLSGVVITVDGTQDLPAPLRMSTDAQGNFRLASAPAGRFFVGIDGRPVTGQYPFGDYYPVVGKAWESIPGEETNIGDVFLPLIVAGTLQPVSTSQDTVITFPPSVLAAHPELEGVHVTVPAGSLYFDDGSPGSSAGIAPVAPDRLPASLPPGLEFPLVITVQTDGAQNFDVPAPVCFPNLPDPATGKPLSPGEKAFLFSFNHDIGSFGPIGFMTASGDGKLVCTDTGVGILAPGWHGVGPVPEEPPPCANQCCEGAPPFGFGGPAAAAGAALPIARVNGRGGESQDFLDMLNCLPPGCNAAGGEGCVDTLQKLFDMKVAQCNKKFKKCIQSGRPKKKCEKERAACKQKANEFAGNAASLCLEKFDNCPGQGGGGGDPAEDPISEEIDRLFDQIGALIEPFGYEDTIPEAVNVQIDGLLAQADQAAGGSVEAYLSTRIAELEADFAAGQENFLFLLGEAPPYPVRYLAEVSRLDGSLLELRGETMAFGFYSLFVPADGEILQVSFYDERTKRFGIQAPFRTAQRPQVFYPFQLFTVEGLDDTDGDSLVDVVEFIYGTNPSDPDSDSDGVPDGAEVDQGLNPLDGKPAKTGIVATAGLPGIALDVCAVDDLAIVACSDRGVSVLNVFQGMDPRIIAQVDTPGTALAVSCSAKRIAVADGEQGVAIIDIADPPAARIVHQLPLPGSTRAVAAAGGIAYAGTSNGEIVSVDIQGGGELGRLRLSKAVEDLAIERDTLFVLVEGTLHSVSILEGPLTVVGSAATPGLVNSANGRMRLFVGGGIAHAVHLRGTNTIDVRDPRHPVLIKATTTTQFGWKQIVLNGSGLGVAAVSPNLAFDGPHNVSLYDTRDPAKTDLFLTEFPTPGIARAVSIYNGLAYVADHDRGLQVINYLAYDSRGVAPAISLEASFSLDPPQVEEGKLARVTAIVTDDVQVRNVEFFVDGAKVATDGNFPFEVQFQTPLLAKQPSFTLRARATDTGGSSAETGLIEVAVLPDTTAPRVLRFEPRSHVQRADAVSAFFSEPLNPATLSEASLRVLAAGPDGLPGTGDDLPLADGSLNYLPEARALVLRFGSPLPDGLYRAVVSAGVEDLAGHSLAQDFTWNFTVAGGSVYWVGPSGLWHVPGNWSLGRPPQAGEQVVLDVGEAVTVDHSQGSDSIAGLFSNEAFVLSSSSTLSITGTVQVNNLFEMRGGTLVDARILPGAGGEGISIETSSTFRNVKVDSDLLLFRGNTGLSVNGPLILGGRLLMAGGPGSGGVSVFFDDPTEGRLEGSGEVLFIGGGENTLFARSSLRIGKDIRIHGERGGLGSPGRGLINEGRIEADGGGFITVHGSPMRNEGTIRASGKNSDCRLSGSWVNAGSLEVAEGATLSLIGEWRNAGTILAQNSTVALGGTFQLSDLGDLQHPGSTIKITGTLINSTGLVLDASTGSWQLGGGTIRGGTVSTRDGSQLVGVRGTLDGVTLNGEMSLTISGGLSVNLSNGFTLNGKVTMAGGPGSGGNSLMLEGASERVLAGEGEVLFASLGGNSIDSFFGGAWRIASGITVHGFRGGLGNSSSPFINEGTVHSDRSGGFIEISGKDWSNAGLIRSSSGGVIFANNAWTNRGTVAVDPSSEFMATKDFTQDSAGELRVSVDGPGQAGKLQVTGTATLAGKLAVELAPGFQPALGARFDVLTCGTRAGEFTSLTGREIGNGLVFSPEYGLDRVTLVVVSE